MEIPLRDRKGRQNAMAYLLGYFTGNQLKNYEKALEKGFPK